MTTNYQQVTAEDVEDLLSRHPRSEATMVRWLDTGEIETVAAALFNDISSSNYTREYETISTAADLRSQGDWDAENPTQDDYEAFAMQLNEAMRYG